LTTPIAEPGKPIKFAFFDFDGTLAETLADLFHAVNFTLRELDLAERTREEVRLFVGDGVHALLRRSLGGDHLDLHEKSLDIFDSYYDQHLLDHTCLLPGVEEAIEAFQGADLAILSNKPENFTRRISDALGITRHFPLIVGPESPEQRKPLPYMMDRALTHFGHAPHEGIFVGDTPVDVETGRRAHVHTVAVLGGFRTRSELEESTPDRIVESLHEVVRLYGTNST